MGILMLTAYGMRSAIFRQAAPALFTLDKDYEAGFLYLIYKMAFSSPCLILNAFLSISRQLLDFQVL